MKNIKKHKKQRFNFFNNAIVNLFVVILFFAAFISASFFTSFIKNKSWEIYFSISFALLDVLFLMRTIKIIHRKSIDVKHSFNSYTRKLASSSQMGLITFNEKGIVIWQSEFIEKIFSTSFVGKPVNDISKKFHEKDIKFNFKYNNKIISAEVDVFSKSIIIQDVTYVENLAKTYHNNKLVVFEIEIDNFLQYKSWFSVEELFEIETTVMKILEKIKNEHSTSYRQYSSGKFLFFANEKTLNIMIENNFEDFTNIKEKIKSLNIFVSLSVGAAYSYDNFNATLQNAQTSVKKAQSRGGGQVALSSPYHATKFYGAQVDTSQSKSKVQIKLFAEMLENKLITSPESIENIIICGHRAADLDAIGAAMAVYVIAKAYGLQDKTYIQNVSYDSTTEGVLKERFTKNSELFIKPLKARSLIKRNSIIVVVDTSNINIIEDPTILELVDEDNRIMIDHHRAPGEEKIKFNEVNKYVDPVASSTCEIMTEIIGFLSKDIAINANEAQIMMDGIYLDTQQFVKSTSYKTFMAASFLEERGAHVGKSNNLLKIPAKYMDTINLITSEAIEVKKGYWLGVYKNGLPPDVVSMATNELLRIQDRKASFVLAKIPGKELYKMSARSFGGVNVQIIAEALGGGGHFTASAAVSEEGIEVFKNNIIQAIVGSGKIGEE